MKKLLVLSMVAATSTVLFSCGGGEKPVEAPVVNQDSINQAMEQARLDSLAQANQTAQDSLNALRIQDSIKNAEQLAAAKSKTSSSSKKATPTKKVVAPDPVKTNPKEDRFNGSGKKTVSDENKADKESRFNGTGKKTVTAEDTKKKAERFK